MSNLSDIEASLNMIVCLKRYDERYAGVNFALLQKDNLRYVVMFNDVPLRQEHDSYKEAFSYAMGYVDGYESK